MNEADGVTDSANRNVGITSRGVTRLDGARRKLDVLMFESEVFRKQMYCIEESTCDSAGTFSVPRRDSAPP